MSNILHSQKRTKKDFRTIGENIKKLRKNIIYKDKNGNIKKGMKQEDFAEYIGVSFDTVKGWEQFYNYPSYETLVHIADMCHCSYDFLFGRIDNIGTHLNISPGAVVALSQMNETHAGIISALLEDHALMDCLAQLCTSEKYYPHTEGLKANRLKIDLFDCAALTWNFVKKYRSQTHKISLGVAIKDIVNSPYNL